MAEMVRRILLTMTVLLVLWSTPRNGSGQELVKGVPYSATIIYTTTSPQRTWSSRVARASNGSTYTELANTGPGHRLPAVYILDAPTRRYITLDPNTKTYSVRLAKIPELHDGQTDDAQVRDRLETFRQIKPRHYAENGYEGDIVPIGFRTEGSRVEYGTRRTYTTLPKTSLLAQKVWDIWYLPALYLDAEKIGYDENNNPVNVSRLTELQAAEPDSHLFEIPQDYTPASAHPIK